MLESQTVEVSSTVTMVLITDLDVGNSVVYDTQYVTTVPKVELHVLYETSMVTPVHTVVVGSITAVVHE